MTRTIHVSDEEVIAAMPDWLKASPGGMGEAARQLYMSSLDWRCDMHAAEGDPDAQDRIRYFAREWDIARHTITLAEAERRWRKSNLRQNPLDFPFRWQSEDGRGTWLTTTMIMERCFGPEPA